MAGSSNPVAPTISTHVLDTEHGSPAVGVHVTLYRLSDDGRPLRLTQALTDADGRVRDLLERPLVVGAYRLEVSLAGERGEPPVADAQIDRFVRRVSIDFHVADAGRSHHVPVLVAPFAITIYRGS